MSAQHGSMANDDSNDRGGNAVDMCSAMNVSRDCRRRGTTSVLRVDVVLVGCLLTSCSRTFVSTACSSSMNGASNGE